MDFRKATNHFADPEFDGEPVQIYEPNPDQPVVPPDEDEPVIPDEKWGDPEEPDYTSNDPPDVLIDDEGGTVKKYYVNNVKVQVAHERVQYYGKDGKLITESLKDYTRDNIWENFSSLDHFILRWNSAEKKEELVRELAEHGILLEALREDVGKDMDDFDLICHVAFDQPAFTRKERADNVRKRNYFAKYEGVAKNVLNGLLEKYESEGIISIEQGSVLKVKPLNELGSPVELVRAFGNKNNFEKALKELEYEIYKEGA